MTIIHHSQCVQLYMEQSDSKSLPLLFTQVSHSITITAKFYTSVVEKTSEKKRRRQCCGRPVNKIIFIKLLSSPFRNSPKSKEISQ